MKCFSTLKNYYREKLFKIRQKVISEGIAQSELLANYD